MSGVDEELRRLDRLQEIYESERVKSLRADFYLFDPISFPKKFARRDDIEVAAFIAAMFAIGPRYAILRSLDRIFTQLGDSPSQTIRSFDLNEMLSELKGHVQFAYKNIIAKDVVQILLAMKNILSEFGTIEDALRSNLDGEPDASFHILTGLLEKMKAYPVASLLGGELTPRSRSLLASPNQGSACKRMNMFLRWMTRSDDIDFGFYSWLGTDRLIIPLDVNVSRASRKLGLTKRKTDNWKTAVEITDQLKRLDPADPVKYDVPLFLFGMELRKGSKSE